MNVNEISEATLSALSEKRARIAALHQRLDDWLTHFDRLCQTVENLLNQRNAVTAAETDLLQDTRRLLAELENVNEVIIDEKDFASPVLSLENSLANAAPSLRSDQLISHIALSVGNKDNCANQFIESAAAAIDKTDNSLSSVVVAPNAFLGMSQFEALNKYFRLCGSKQTLSEIITDLPRGGFYSQAEHVEQSFRSMLRYYTAKGVFEREGESWGLPNQPVLQEAASLVSLSASPPIVEFSNNQALKANVGSLSENESLQNALTPKGKSLLLVRRPSGRNSHCAYPQNELTTPQYCAEILRQSGQPWLHVDQILVIMERDYGVKRRKVIVASALRKNAKAKRFFKAFGDNRYGLLSEVAGEVKASA